MGSIVQQVSRFCMKVILGIHAAGNLLLSISVIKVIFFALQVVHYNNFNVQVISWVNVMLLIHCLLSTHARRIVHRTGDLYLLLVTMHTFKCSHPPSSVWFCGSLGRQVERPFKQSSCEVRWLVQGHIHLRRKVLVIWLAVWTHQAVSLYTLSQFALDHDESWL